jgi:hypothetical protein
MSDFNYEEIETRALAHMVYRYGPSGKSVFIDHDALRELSRRQAAYHVTAGVYADHSGVLTSEPASRWDPDPPLSQGRQRFLSSRETIERLAFVLPPEPRSTTG